MRSVRRAEIAAALSVAADAGMGHPPDLTLTAAAVAARLARAAGFSENDVRACWEVALLRFAGCTSESGTAAEVFGDEVSGRRAMAVADFGYVTSVLSTAFRRLHTDAPLPTRIPRVLRAIAGMGALFGAAIAHCEVAQTLAGSLGCDERVVAALALAFERWDGRGIPKRLREDAVPLEVQVSSLAHDVTLFHRLFGFESALAMAKGRAGGAFSPKLAAAMVKHRDDVLVVLDLPSPWSAALDEEPEPKAALEGDAIERAVAALGDFGDLKGACRAGHSRVVATIAANAGRRAGLDEVAQRELRWAAHAHDLGVAATTAAIWDKRGPLTDAEREAIRFHPYVAERCLARSKELEKIGWIVSLHHERLDGGGYPKGIKMESLSISARILAVADAVQAMSAVRPHRHALSPEQISIEIAAACKSGALCEDAARAVLDTRSERQERVALPRPGALSEREVEVLRHLAAGRTLKEVATTLDIATKTADNHTQRIYEKIGVTTRAAATLWAMRNGVLPQ